MYVYTVVLEPSRDAKTNSSILTYYAYFRYTRVYSPYARYHIFFRNYPSQKRKRKSEGGGGLGARADWPRTKLPRHNIHRYIPGYHRPRGKYTLHIYYIHTIHAPAIERPIHCLTINNMFKTSSRRRRKSTVTAYTVFCGPSWDAKTNSQDVPLSKIIIARACAVITAAGRCVCVSAYTAGV